MCKCPFRIQAGRIFTKEILKSPLLRSEGLGESDILSTSIRKTELLHVECTSELTKTKNLL